MATGVEAEHGLAMRFHVDVHGHDLGLWAKCDGLYVDFEVLEWKEGGENGYTHRLPGRMQYKSIVLARAITDAGWKSVLGYLKSVRDGLQSMASDYKGATLTIDLYDSQKGVVATWEMQNAYPMKWTGPSLAAGKSDFAMETLEFAHEGFL